MATSTTNLGLIKPSGSDKIRIAQINQNMDTIDEKIGPVGSTSLQAQLNTANQAISTHDFGNLTVTEFKTALASFVDSSMAPNELRPIRVSIADSSDAFANTIYVGWVSKNGNNSTRTTVDLHAASTGTIIKRRVTGELYNTDWHFDNLALYSDIAYSRGTYMPTITAGSGFAVDNVSFRYNKLANLLQVCGRFNITNAGSENAAITISLPSGMTAYGNGVGSCGSVNLSKSFTSTGLSVRINSDSNEVVIQAGAGGNSSNLIGTGYVMVDFIVFLK